MSKQLSAEWQQKIDDEALELTKRFKDNNDYQAGCIQGFQDGYSKGAVVYGTQLVEAQERIKTLEAVLSEIANYNNNFSDFGNWLGCRQLARKAILPDNTIKKEDA